MSNLLIVESKNDKAFIRALIEHLNMPHLQVDDNPVCNIDDIDCMGGLNEKKLEERLNALKNQLPKNYTDSIGIILDHDGKRDERLSIINSAIQTVFNTEQNVSDEEQFISATAEVGGDEYKIQIACHLVSVGGKGELETVLKAIKTKNSTYADCLESWKNCVEVRTHGDKNVSCKEFDKFWLNTYLRFDTCSRNERKQTERKCSIKEFEYILTEKKEIFDFDHQVLDSLKSFLRLFE